jgi:acetyl-CoA/propionyl-CoA carboxylase biotin carboxyl carrier protein
MLRALSEFEVAGVETLIPIHQAILEHPNFIAGGSLHEFVEGGGYAATLDPAGDPAAGPVEVAVENHVRTVVTEVDGKRFEVNVVEPEHPGRTRLRQRRAEMAERERAAHGGSDVIASPMQGTVLKVAVEAGAEVEPGEVLVVVEAMKMENEIVAHHAGTVDAVEISVGDQVAAGQALLRLV